MRNLHVWSDSTHIGVFSQRSGGSLVRFEYDDAKGAPISLSLPRTGAYSDIAPKAFLENLLPESRKARWRMADRLGVDSGTHADGQIQTQEGGPDVSGAEGGQTRQ